MKNKDKAFQQSEYENKTLEFSNKNVEQMVEVPIIAMRFQVL